MIRLAIIVEGATEDVFVRDVLAEYLREGGVYAQPIVIKSPRSRQGNMGSHDTTHKGGNVSVDRIVRHAMHLMDKFDWVTTLVDFYGFGDRPSDDCEELERLILGEMQKRTGRPCTRFVPYVQRHEFEALLFSDVRAMCSLIPDCTEGQRQALADVCRQFETPEEINDGPQTAPSKRLERIFKPQEYDKVSMGPVLADAVTVETMREKCPRFGRWLGRLLRLNEKSNAGKLPGIRK